MNNQGVLFQEIVDFLKRLQQNNNKQWMDAHRAEYHKLRDGFIAWLDFLNAELAQIDGDYFNTPGKKAMNRINNNLMFHPNRPVYKDHFAAGLDQLSKQGDFYVELGIEEVFIGGGYWHPDAKTLKSIRQAIDYNGEQLKGILGKSTFKKNFGGLIVGDSLTWAPKGYSQEHPHIDLLKRKSFAVACKLPLKEAFKADFNARLIDLYKEMLPFRRYLNQAVTV